MGNDLASVVGGAVVSNLEDFRLVPLLTSLYGSCQKASKPDVIGQKQASYFMEVFL